MPASLPFLGPGVSRDLRPLRGGFNVLFTAKCAACANYERETSERRESKSETSSLRNSGPQAIRPESKGFLLLQRSSVLPRVCTYPPALSTRAAPAATSHSCFGVRVKVTSAFPAATSPSLYATEPMARMSAGLDLNHPHSPRSTSLRLARTSAPSNVILWLALAGWPL